jgi:hypothetical protein
MQHVQLGRKMPIFRRLAAAVLATGLLAAPAFSFVIPQVLTVALTARRKRRHNHASNNNIHNNNNLHHIINYNNNNNNSDHHNHANNSNHFSDATSSSIPLDSNIVRGSQQYHKLDERTRTLLCRSKRGQWTCDHFQQAQDAVKEYASRQNGRSAVLIERLLRRTVEELMAGNNDNATLDLVAPMYTLAIQGWAKSGEQGGPQRAEEFLDHMMKGYELGDVTLKPEISAFNAVLVAYADSQQQDAPQQALRVLQKLNDWNAQGRTDVKPNKESYAAILKAYSKIGDHQAPDLVHKLLAHMEKLSQQGFPSVKPDYVCKNVYLSALLEAMGRGTLPGSQGARLAHDYLVQMMTSPDLDGKPDTWSFNMVISAWSKSGSRDVVEHAEALVTQLEAYHEVQRQQLAELHHDDFGEDSGETLNKRPSTPTLLPQQQQQQAECEKTRPNTNTYNCLIACYGRSSLEDKGQRAHAILNRMKGLVETGVNLSVKPDTVTYNSVMNCYGKSEEKDAPIVVESLLREMQQLFEETGDRSTKPNSRSFNTCVSIKRNISVHAPVGASIESNGWTNHFVPVESTSFRDPLTCRSGRTTTYKSFSFFILSCISFSPARCVGTIEPTQRIRTHHGLDSTHARQGRQGLEQNSTQQTIVQCLLASPVEIQPALHGRGSGKDFGSH